MKNFFIPSIFLFLSLLLVASCTIDKEPTIPTGANNEKAPVFLSTNLTAITHDSLRAKARLSTRGNLNILHHGWVWSENPNPTLQNDKLELGALEIDSFETLIPGLTLGKTYHLRPYVVTGSGETYGPEKIIFMGVPKLNDIVLVADSACFLRVQSGVQSPVSLVEYGIVYLQGVGTPTLQNVQVPVSGLNNGIFQVNLTMLSPNSVYSIRAYAITSFGVGFSRAMLLTTPTGSSLSANFTINIDAELFQGAIVQFTNISFGATAYSWSFGDGQTSTEVSPSHIFNTQGNMTVRLSAENGGCMVTKDTLLKIIADPFPDYWRVIPAGTFTMGCTSEQGIYCEPSEYPIHQVTLNSFFMGKTEVTQKQWQAVTGSNPSNFYQCGLDCPVENISWNRIIDQFIPALYRKTGRIYRLPTEAEWEYAARGGADLAGATTYAGSNNLSLVGWHNGNSQNITHAVSKKLLNGYGLYDMNGNVEEWCNDWYRDTYYTISPSVNPLGPSTGYDRVVRGGSWYSEAFFCRLADRLGVNPNTRESGYGFRLARD